MGMECNAIRSTEQLHHPCRQRRIRVQDDLDASEAFAGDALQRGGHAADPAAPILAPVAGDEQAWLGRAAICRVNALSGR